MGIGHRVVFATADSTVIVVRGIAGASTYNGQKTAGDVVLTATDGR